MRRVFLLIACFAWGAPAAAQESGTLSFLRKPQTVSDAMRSYREPAFRPVRIGEVRSSGFLTEGAIVPFGRALGPTSPTHIRAPGSYAVSMLRSSFAVRPPEGVTYAVGDTLIAGILSRGPKLWGDIFTPTALVVVTGHDANQTLTAVATVYGPLRDGQAVLPLDPFSDPGETRQVESEGPEGIMLGSRETRELLQSGSYIFTDLGADDGVRVGDLVQVRRRATARVNAAGTIEEPMATGQVVHVNTRSSTVRLANIMSPDILPGVPVVRTARMP